ncbi:SDR family NAD(P)-dependent oxidoreductase [Nonomuraea typhae]|uniref:SDR family NAD(P)-dependent oxidoreductase n=1 Tax=Nonomuraea typhae TaxID=2603600 RepID=A0ABW7YV05_9ACTN
MGTEEKLRAYLKRVTVELAQARRNLTEAEDRRHEPIAVIGMACRYPGGGDTVEGLWELLREGRHAVGEVPPARWDIDAYYDPDPQKPGGMYTRYGCFLDDVTGWDAEFFGISPREALRMDPQQRLLLELAWEGLENAGLAPTRMKGSRTGVMVGYMDTLQYGRLQIELQGRDAVSDPYLGQGAIASVAAGRIAYQLDLVGPTLTVDTACSSSLIAVHLAVESLRRGECDMALAAGCSLTLHPSMFIQACAGMMMCSDGRCKTFDEGADGYVMGEGGGLVVLEPLSKALANGRRIRAVIRGSAANQDGRSNGLTAPSRNAQVDVITRAHAAARVHADDVDYVEAHGSGTQLGDAIELSALHDVFGRRPAERPLRVGAIKTNIGHTQAAAGVAGLIKTVLILENGVIPPNLNMDRPATAIHEDGTIRPVTEALETAPRLAGVSSFGLSGSNAHVVLEAAPERSAQEEGAPAPERASHDAAGSFSQRASHDAAGSPSQRASRDAAAPGRGSRDAAWPAVHALPVSAGSQAALREQAVRLAGRLAADPGLAPADVARTLHTGRAALDHRRLLVVNDVADAVTRLRALAGGPDVARAKDNPRIAFLLPGVGDQYAGLGKELYAAEPVYAQAVDACVELVRRHADLDLLPFFAADPVPREDGLAAMLGREGGQDAGDDPLEHAPISHPFQFTVEYALARLLAHWGVAPDMLIGYSLGEYVAACLAGVFTLEDAVRVVIERAHLINAVPAGRMVAVAAAEQRIREVLPGLEVDVAALNGPSMTVLSGLPTLIERATADLMAAGLACRPMRSAHAFHSSLLQPARDKLFALLETVPRQAPALTIVSNLTGATLTAEQAVSASYWADQLVSPVRFADGVRHCVDQEIDVFVELGAGQTLGGLVRQNLAGGAPAAVLGTLPALWTAGERRDARTELLECAGRLWEAGAAVRWELTGPATAGVVTLPAYPFQRTRFWPEPASGMAGTDGALTGTGGTDGALAGSGERGDGVRMDGADFRFVPSWRQDPVRPVLPDMLSLPGPLVVFSEGAAGTALADLAEAGGGQVVEVFAGSRLHRDGRRLTIDPADPAHYAEVFGGLAPGPVHVAHLWSLLTAREDLAAAIGHGFDSLLLAVQSLTVEPGARLLTVTRGATEVLGGDNVAPQQALAHGFGRAVQHEFKELSWTGVDLDPADGDRAEGDLGAADRAGGDQGPTDRAGGDQGGAGRVGGQLAGELVAASGGSDALAAWRRGRRWVRAWAEVPGESGDTGSPWRGDGVYLVTGGTRGLGMGLARHLVRTGVRKLALLSRTPLDRNAAPEPGSRTERTLTDVAALEAAGAEVLLVAADTGDPAQFERAIAGVREHYGALHGVIHSAGLPAGGLMQRRTVAEARAVLAPKVLAMGPLARLVSADTAEHERPELLVLYSSAVTAFGGIGEGDYCAANTVLDAYGEALAATAPSTRVVAISWGPWLHDDWQAENFKSTGGLAERVRNYRERYGFAEEAGNDLLDTIIRGGHGHVLAARQPLGDVVREWTAMLDIDNLIGEAVPRGERFPRPQLRTDYAEPRNEREALVAELWGAYLGIAQVGVHDPFFDLGGNSLVGMAMVLAIEKELGVPIAPAVLFEHPTVAAFTAAVDGGASATKEALTSSSARGQRRRRARAGTRKGQQS